MKPLENNVIAVTNAGRGFGHAVARAVALAGASVLVMDSNAEAASAVASGLDSLGCQAIPVKVDCSVQLEVRHAFEKTLMIYGALNGLVHVADGTSNTVFRKMHEAEWVDLFESNAHSSFLMVNQLVRHCKGAWVTMIAPPEDAIEPQVVALRSTITGFVRGLADSGVRANAVIPSRAARGLDADHVLSQAVLALALPSAKGISGAVTRVALPSVVDNQDFESLDIAGVLS